jgi:hypothetical protein
MVAMERMCSSLRKTTFGSVVPSKRSRPAKEGPGYFVLIFVS